MDRRQSSNVDDCKLGWWEGGREGGWEGAIDENYDDKLYNIGICAILHLIILHQIILHQIIL